MGADADFLGRLGPELQLVLPMLDERSRRLVPGMSARAAGEGGTGAVAALAGASWQTVADGAAEIASGETLPEGRARRPGGGRKKLAETGPGLLDAMKALVADSSRGDPESPLEWTTKSMRHLSDELTAQGHPCSAATCWRMLRAEGYRTQTNYRAAAGRGHPDRDGQFRYISAQAKEHRDAGQPVISVDAKKKEPAGNYAQRGAEWRPKGDPVRVAGHSFGDEDTGHAIPYGIYDQAANTGFVNVGTDGNTAALAVESVRRWRDLAGKDACPGARRLLVTCDAGGPDSSVNRAWKTGLSQLAQETGLEITVCHFPPGTSKWNKIEHRLFSQISLAWRGRPLTSYDVIISTIGNVTTTTGLDVTAVLDRNPYPAGLETSDAQMKDLEDRGLARHEWHGTWNCTLLPVLRPAPGPAPDPAPRGTDPAVLNQPALTGMDPADVNALAAALDIPARARREHDLITRQGRPRAGNGGRKAANSPAAYLTAALMHRHLGLPHQVTAALLGVNPATACRSTRRITALIGTISPPPAATPRENPIRTLDDLREYAAGHGITITTPPGIRHSPRSHNNDPDTPQTPFNLNRLQGGPDCAIECSGQLAAIMNSATRSGRLTTRTSPIQPWKIWLIEPPYS